MPQLMAKLARLWEGLARPMPTVKGNEAAEANRTLLELMKYDELRPLIRSTNLVVADKRLKKPMNSIGIGGLGGPLATGNAIIVPGADDRVMAHELGHVRQSIRGLPVRNDREVEAPMREALRLAMIHEMRGK